MSAENEEILDAISRSVKQRLEGPEGAKLIAEIEQKAKNVADGLREAKRDLDPSVLDRQVTL